MADDLTQGLGVTPTDLDPDVVHNLLQMEAKGQIPETIKPHIAKARAAGILPPPLLGASNPEGFNQKPATPPQPQQGFLSSTIANVADAVPEVTQWFKDNFGTPEALGGLAGTYGGEMIGQPTLGAGFGAAAVALGHEIYNRLRYPNPNAGIPTLENVGSAFVSGVTGELGAKGMAGLSIRKPVTPTGDALQNFFGRDLSGAHQIAESPMLDFMANVAKYGPGGKQTMEDFEQRQSQHVLDHLRDVSGSYNTQIPQPPAGSPISVPRTITVDPMTGDLDLGAAGQRLQTDIAGQVKAAPQKSGYPRFLQDYGGMQRMVPEMGTDSQGNLVPTGKMVGTGPTVGESHAARSEALAEGRRTGISRQDRFDAMQSAAKHQVKLEKALPDQAARDEYTNLAQKYRTEINRVDNPTAESLRTGKSNDVIDNILNSKLHDEPDLTTGTGHSNVQLLDKIQKAASPNAWEQLQADTVERMANRSMKDGVIDPNMMEKVLSGMDEPTQRKLFGNNLSDIRATLSVLHQANRYKESEAGRLFIAIRTGQAGIKAAGAVAGLGALVAGGAAVGQHEGGKTGAVAGGLATAATILVSPKAFAKLLTSEVGRTLLTRAVRGGSNQMMQKTAKALIRFGAQNVAETARESIVGNGEEQPIDPNYDDHAFDSSIPEPPR